ncbi:MAG: S53 family peptidase [Actinobacteria bacterium]|nr:S53 family peptidase [Actinomycetota bacterium]
MAGFLLPSAQAGAAAPPTRLPVPPSPPLRARITGAAIPGTSAAVPAAPGAASGLPSKQDQIKRLKAVLAKMKKNFAQFSGTTPGPADIFDYNIGALWRQGIDGAGTTIAVMEGWHYLGIAGQVANFDKQFGLPNPQIRTIYPAGPLPAKCPAGMVKLQSYGSCNAWKGELTLDVIAAHLIAPYAKIIISATPADTEITGDPAENVAMPEIMKGVEFVSSHHLADVMSISDGTGETTYPAGPAQVTSQNAAELTAAANGVPVLVATGDCGVVQNLAEANAQCSRTSATPDTAAWDDSPWVTAVGGSVPNLSLTTGQRLGPDPVWHVGGAFSEGAGFSSVFHRPSYQDGVAGITRSPMRSVPDITLDSQDGTSESAPLLAGVLALATQVNKADVGPVNPALYRALGPRGAQAGIADVVKGNNSVTTPDGKTVIVRGFTAGRGFDVASGWGTLNAARFVPALAAATAASHQDQAIRAQAQAQLTGLQHSVQLSAGHIPAGGTSYLLGSNLLPGHPVGFAIDGHTVATLTANALGDVTYMIDPSLLKLAPGRHTITLRGMLLTETARFTSS